MEPAEHRATQVLRCTVVCGTEFHSVSCMISKSQRYYRALKRFNDGNVMPTITWHLTTKATIGLQTAQRFHSLKSLFFRKELDQSKFPNYYAYNVQT